MDDHREVPSLLLAREHPGEGYTRTLARHVSDMLTFAEQRYGPRDRDFTFVGVEFCEDGPCVWYPGAREEERKHIAIRLTLDCINEEARAWYQLAHEVFHLLAPRTGSPPPPVNIFEEGLAALFALWYVNDYLKQSQRASERYASAAEVVKKLLAFDSKIVRNIRLRQPSFRYMKPADLLAVCPTLPADLIVKLLAPF
jgi:hypothetical protein